MVRNVIAFLTKRKCSYREMVGVAHKNAHHWNHLEWRTFTELAPLARHVHTLQLQNKYNSSIPNSQVYYEQLVLHPEEWMRKILKFVDVPWNQSVLHHDEFINKPNGVSLSKWVRRVQNRRVAFVYIPSTCCAIVFVTKMQLNHNSRHSSPPPLSSRS